MAEAGGWQEELSAANNHGRARPALGSGVTPPATPERQQRETEPGKEPEQEPEQEQEPGTGQEPGKETRAGQEEQELRQESDDQSDGAS